MNVKRKKRRNRKRKKESNKKFNFQSINQNPTWTNDYHAKNIYYIIIFIIYLFII